MIMKTSHNHKSPPRSQQMQTMPPPSSSSSTSSSSSSSSSACSHTVPGETTSSQAPNQSYIPTKLYVTNFAFSCSQRQIQELFGQYGQVVECTLKKDYYAYILFTSVKSSLGAFKSANGLKVFGRKLTVHLATSKKSQSHLQNTHQLLNSLNLILNEIGDHEDETASPFDLPFDIPKIIHVRNFPETCTVQQIRDIFVQYGDIVECLILHDSYAFVHFKSPLDARLALQSTNNQPLLNSNTNLLVQYSRSKFKSHSTTSTAAATATTTSTTNNNYNPETLDDNCCDYNYEYTDDFDEETNRQDEMAMLNAASSSTTISCRTKLYVTNFPDDMDQEEMKQLFNQYGQVLECTIMWNQYAFVHFGSYGEAEKALNALKGTQYKGYKISVQWSTSSKYQQPKQHQSKQENTIKILERPGKADTATASLTTVTATASTAATSSQPHSNTWASLVNKTTPPTATTTSPSSSSSSNKQTINVNNSNTTQTFKISFSEIVRSSSSSQQNGMHNDKQQQQVNNQLNGQSKSETKNGGECVNEPMSVVGEVQSSGAQGVGNVAPILQSAAKLVDEPFALDESEHVGKHVEQTVVTNGVTNDKSIAPIGTQQQQQQQQLQLQQQQMHQQHLHLQQQKAMSLMRQTASSSSSAPSSAFGVAAKQRPMLNPAQLNTMSLSTQSQPTPLIQIPQLHSTHFHPNNVHQYCQSFDSHNTPSAHSLHNPTTHHHHHHHHQNQMSSQMQHHHHHHSSLASAPPSTQHPTQPAHHQHYDYSQHHTFYTHHHQQQQQQQHHQQQQQQQAPIEMYQYGYAAAQPPQSQFNQMSYGSYAGGAPVPPPPPPPPLPPSQLPPLPAQAHNLAAFYPHQYQPLFASGPAPPWTEASSVSLDAFALNDRHHAHYSLNPLVNQQYAHDNKECMMQTAPTFADYPNGLLMKQQQQQTTTCTTNSQGLLSNALANLTISSSVAASGSSRSSSSSSSSSSSNLNFINATNTNTASTASNSGGSSSSTPTANPHNPHNKQLSPNKPIQDESNALVSSFFNSYVLFPSDSFDLTNEKLACSQNDDKSMSSHQSLNNGLGQQPFYQIEDVLANLIR